MKKGEFKKRLRAYINDTLDERGKILSCLGEIKALRDTFGDYSEIKNSVKRLNVESKKKRLSEILHHFTKLYSTYNIDALIHRVVEIGNSLIDTRLDDPELLDDQELLRGLYLKKHLEPLIVFKNTITKLKLLQTLFDEEREDALSWITEINGDLIILNNEDMIKFKNGKPNFKNLYTAIAFFDAAAANYSITDYGTPGQRGGKKNSIIAKTVLINGRPVTTEAVKKARQRMTQNNYHREKIKKALPHL